MVVSATLTNLRRAYAEFLLVPTVIIGVFLLLAAGMHLLDRSRDPSVAPVRSFMHAHVFADPQSTSSFLTTIAGSIITVTSITFSLLLLAVQQSAASLTSQVFDQFLQRPINQIYLGFFTGLAFYTLLTLATVHKPFNPVLGATVDFGLAVVALYLLTLLLYNTINQMRPSQIVEAIHQHTLRARQNQLPLLGRTRRIHRYSGPITRWVVYENWGFVTRIDIDVLAAAIDRCQREIEVGLLISIGSFVGFGDSIARISAERNDEADILCKAVRQAVRLERTRDLRNDPAFGIEQLTTIAWTSASTAKQDLVPAILTIHLLRDILARWSNQASPERNTLPVVYLDHVPASLLAAFEAMLVVSSESHQYQIAAETVDALASLFDRLPTDTQDNINDILHRVLPVVTQHPRTVKLASALHRMASVLAGSGHEASARDVRAAVQSMHE